MLILLGEMLRGWEYWLLLRTQVWFPALPGGSQRYVTLVTGGPMPSSGLCVYQICIRCISIYADKTPVHIEVNNSCKSWYWLLGIVCWAFLVSAWYSQSALSPSSAYGPGSDLPGAVCGFSFTPSLLVLGLLSLYLLQSLWLLSRQVSRGKATPLCWKQYFSSSYQSLFLL